MKINPTESQRIVLLDIQSDDRDQPPSSNSRAVQAEFIVCINIVVDNGTRVTEAKFHSATEKDLLREFWQAVHPHDVFFGRNIASRLEFVRQRSWKAGLIPSPGVNLRALYLHHTVETGAPPSSADDGGYRSAGALAYLLGLPGNRPEPKKCRVP
jgi:hypothetical protein